jgi:succinoglycan biosynthesis transport protein ExoP
MDLKDYFLVIRHHWLVISAIAALAAGAAFGVSALMTPSYEARSQLFVAVRGGDSVTDLAQGNSFSERRVSSYVTLATSSKVLNQVIDELHLDMTTARLKQLIKVSSPAQTVLIDIAVENGDPKLAHSIANAVAENLIDEVGIVEGSSADGSSLVTISVVEDAATPSTPVSPNIPRNTALGFLVGGLVGILFAICRKLFDTRIRDRAGLASVTDMSVLGSILAEPELEKRPLAILTEPHGVRAEHFRQLRTQLQFTNLDQEAQSVLVTSCIPGEGKSSTSINLALILAEAGGRVLLIDADLRRPRVADYLHLEGAVGLTTVLSGRVDVDDAIQTVGTVSQLHVLTAGRIPPNPSELLGSAAMDRLLETLGGRYDTIIIDAPPVIPVTDPAVLASKVSGVMLVVSVDGRLRREQLTEGVEKLSQVGARVLGLTLNRVTAKASAYSTYEYRATEKQTRMSKRERRKRVAAGPRRTSRTTQRSVEA